MVMETIQNVIQTLGASDIDERLEERLLDGIIYAFQEQTTEDQVMLDGFGVVVNALGIRVKPYLMQIVSVVLFRLGNKSAKVRQQAADLTTRLAVVIKQCGEIGLLNKVGEQDFHAKTLLIIFISWALFFSSSSERNIRIPWEGKRYHWCKPHSILTSI
jgi:hypothetical protein